jgi:16S rRNA (adenine1518-N6/adenine1519-N6)-dimethyltransferase
LVTKQKTTIRPTTRTTARVEPRRHTPRKRFGQHFLAPTWAARVVAAIAPRPGDVFLEIGPGTGALTLPLAASGAPVLAVEIDRDLAADLATRVPGNVTVLTGDFLEMDVVPYLTGLMPQRGTETPGTSARRQFRVVGNLPYNLSSPILFRLIDLHLRHGLFSDATVMLQREVAARLAARVGTREYGVLSIHGQLHADISVLLKLPPTAFKPAPRVDSAIARLAFTPPKARIADQAVFDRLVQSMFSHRRKTLRNAVKSFDPAGGLIVELSGLDGQRRPETLQVTEIARLVELFASAKRPPVL